MAEEGSVSGGNKPVHRFLRGEPKSIGVALMMMALGLVMFGITMNIGSDTITSAQLLIPFWLATLFFICGLLYVLAERNPSKKIITGSLAMSIITILGVINACNDILRCISRTDHKHWYHLSYNRSKEENLSIGQHYNPLKAMEYVFIAHSVVGGTLLVIISFFCRAALRSSNTQAIVLMRNLPSAE